MTAQRARHEKKRHEPIRMAPHDASRGEPAGPTFSIWGIIFRVALVIGSAFFIFLFAFWLTEWFFRRYSFHPGPYVVHMTGVMVAFFLMIIGGTTIGRITAPKQRLFFQLLIDAIRQMAKGNFNVRVPVEMVREPGGERHPFRQLVYSLNNMAEELAQMEELRQEFISNVSHEIQSPLTAIAGFVQALKNDDLTKEQRLHYLDIIETESKRLSRMSDNLLKLTSLESGRHPFHPEAYRLDRQIREVVLSCEPLWIQKELQLDVSLPPIEVVADKDLVSQVWMNLLTNAIKFTGRHGTIAISLHTEDKWAVVRIADSGIGIAEEDLPRIFERFYKADKARTRTTPGSGLGLAIVKKIVDFHHGDIGVESRLGVGTAFTVRLPLEFQPSTGETA
jgi:two-component system phosphate regulon sensor histidine kinase PhoR